MKLAKIIGLAAIAAMALLAVGAGPASASLTTLCKSSAESPNCGSANIYASGEINATSSNTSISGRFLGFSGTIQCGESSLKGKTSAAFGEVLPVSVSAWSLGGCKTSFGGTCTVTSEGAPYSGSLSWLSGTNGALSVSSGGKGAPGWTFKCGGFPNVSCTLSFSPTLDMNGGNPATIVASAEPMSGVGSNCPEKSQPITFSATYSVSSPSPAYVAKASESASTTALCKEAGVTLCPSGQLYSKGTAINAESSSLSIVTNSSVVGTITCSQATISGETTATTGSPLPINLSMPLKSCFFSGGGEGGYSCESPEAISGTSSLNWITGSAGALKPTTVGWRFNCAGFFPNTLKCTFYMDGTQTMAVEGGKPATVALNGASLKITEEGSLWCGSSAKATGTYSVTSPSPAYVTKG